MYCMYVCMHACMYVLYLYIYVCIYVCMYMYIYIYTHTYFFYIHNMRQYTLLLEIEYEFWMNSKHSKLLFSLLGLAIGLQPWSLVPGRSQDLPSVGDPIVLQMMVTPKHPTPAVQTHEWLMPHHGDPGPKYWLRRASPQPTSTRYR